MTGHSECIAFISMPGTGEWMVILFIGLLIFGRRLPEVARNLGKSVNEFKKGLKEFQDSAGEVVSDVNRVSNDVVNDVASQMNETSGTDSSGGDSHGYEYGGENAAATGTSQPEVASEPTQTTGPIDQPPDTEKVEPMK